MLHHVLALGRQRLRIVIGNPDLLFRVIKVRRRSDGIPVADESILQHGFRRAASLLANGRPPRLKEAMVVGGNLAPHMAVKGHAQHDLRGRNAGPLKLAHRLVGRGLLRVGGIGEQGRVMSGGRVRRALVVVVGHQVHRVEISLRLLHLGMIEKLGGRSGRNGEIEIPAELLFQRIEALPQFLEQQRVSPLVLGTIVVCGSGQARILPVDVQPVELMLSDELGHAVNKDGAALFGEGDVGEAARPEPSARGDEHSQGRVLLLQRNQSGQVLIVVGVAGHDAAVLQIGEGVVDARQLLRGNLARLNQAVFCKDIGDDHRLVR